ncbi:ankyrin repeat domain-containing protein [Endozoicomonas sp. SCSIO W0465]|uniref:ankyrin repeat domain-containing protein n=1 Tax=Endozoicomonas sp. SCSIO W0465 TaxID=2918516 RepID=UPI002076153B|nr:ankyrin repeat domain-containing protein [Endozoicomonas sp. SCSIO W0465]USE38292.1 ankyrin repeat domain-containing protein [Endozoicomonas sp. SCSIO W0465]
MLACEKNQVASADPLPAPASGVDYGEHALVTACRNNDLEFLTASEQLRAGINYLYENKKELSQVEQSVSLLHIACYENHPEVVKLLLESGANPDIKLPKSGLTPIDVACADKQLHQEIISLLANYLFPHRLDVNTIRCVTSPDYPGDFTLLQLACRSGNAHAINTLLNNQADPKQVAPGWKVPPLHLLCDTDIVDTDIISRLVAKAPVNSRYRGSTALHTLCSGKQCNQQVLDALLAKGADVNAMTPKGVTPLMLASQNNAWLASHLISGGCVDVNMADSRGWQAIHYAAQSGHETVINMLLDKRADANAENHKGVTPLHLAVMGKHESTIYALLDHGADISTKAPVTAYSPAETCKITTLVFCGVIFCPMTWLLWGEYRDRVLQDKPIHEREVSRYAQSCCPAHCSLSPLELADEGLQERMISRTITTDQPGSLPNPPT